MRIKTGYIFCETILPYGLPKDKTSHSTYAMQQASQKTRKSKPGKKFCENRIWYHYLLRPFPWTNRQTDRAGKDETSSKTSRWYFQKDLKVWPFGIANLVIDRNILVMSYPSREELNWFNSPSIPHLFYWPVYLICSRIKVV